METLYRKYRSRTFRELVGQDQAKQILRNAIRRGRLSHAYLFTGPRGTGKTSVARIFAKALCCLNPQDGDCCGECANCLAIAGGQALDVQEIDAASKNKVDDIRELRDRVGYAPAQFPYKIYIIDEVHMVTPQGFNALLKTLEEPPAHVKFLLCTTEAHKLPVTILSRCIRLDFTRIALPQLGAHLQWIALQEGFTLDEDAALELAALAEGSARDAISLLDQLTVYCERHIARADVRELFQLGDPELVPGVANAIGADNKRELLDTWERLAGQGADAGRFLLQISDELKQRFIDTGEAGWRRALDAVWQGLNLLKQESFPALLVELSLLQAAEAFNAPPVATAPAAAGREQGYAPDRPGPVRGAAPDSDGTASRRPDFLRRPREDAPQPAAQPLRQAPPPTPPARSGPVNEPGHPPAQFDEPLPEPPPAHEDAPPRAVEPPVAHPAQQPAAERPKPAPDAPNPALADPRFTAFLERLRGLNLPAYVLAAQYAQPELRDGTLRLGFEGAAQWGRAACAYAQSEELLAAYAVAAESSYDAGKVCIGIAGEGAGWKCSGSPFDIAGPAARAPQAPAPHGQTPPASGPGAQSAAAHKLFARKAGQPPAPDEPTDSFSDDAEVSPEQVLGEHPRHAPQPRELEGDVEQLGSQIDKAAKPIMINTPATVEDVLELFSARILTDEEP